MQTNQRVEALKKSGRKFSSPMVVLALIDTGASISVLDSRIVAALGFEQRGIVSVHTPTTESAYELRKTYDALFIVGETLAEPHSKAIQVVETDWASQGIYALIGRDFLSDCRLVYDGPRKSFTLEYDTPWAPASAVSLII
jgi:hypothetical protein